ncbi:MAG: helix-turn-helix transcriptional regulator, partial [Desulfobacterales bacterium]|nr:helix-turn-helix transcriptional regulator [Desulfobacterales bacterium]
MLGKCIKDLREREGLTRAALAGRAGLTPDELARVEDENVEALPAAELLKIADAFHLKKVVDFATLMRLNGVSRRFHALGLGLPKTGTTSLAGIFGGYRSAHEFQQWETHQAVIAYKNGRASR